MNTILHATFTDAKDGISAVESLLHHGMRAEDINLILPESTSTDAATVRVSNEVARSTNHPSAAPPPCCHEERGDMEQGAGLGLAFGLVAAMCVPGIGMIVGSGAIVAGIMAAGTAAGGLTAGIYGYLTDRGIDAEIARKVTDHLAAGGTTLSVSTTGELNATEITHILEVFGGHLIRRPKHA